jgi:hypothetical protein
MGQRGFETGVTDIVGLVVEVRISNDPFVGPEFIAVGTHARVKVAEETADLRRIRTAHYGRQRGTKVTGNIKRSYCSIAEGHSEEQTNYPRSLNHNSP